MVRGFNPSSIIIYLYTYIQHIVEKSYWKTFLKKAKVLKMSFFCPFGVFSAIFINPFLNNYFRLFWTERVCRWPFQIWWKWKKVLQMGRKHSGKRRKCSLWVIYPFLSVLKSIVLQTCKNQGLFGKGLSLKFSSQTLSVWKSLKLIVWERVKGWKAWGPT